MLGMGPVAWLRLCMGVVAITFERTMQRTAEDFGAELARRLDSLRFVCGCTAPEATFQWPLVVCVRLQNQFIAITRTAVTSGRIFGFFHAL